MKRQSPEHVRGFLSRFLEGKKSWSTGLNWRLVVGKALAEVSDLVQVRGRTVVVWANSETTRRELLKLESQVLSLVLGEQGRRGKLVVVYGERPQVDEAQNNSGRPHVFTGNPGEKHDQQEQVRDACQNVEDEELRVILEQFLSWKAPKGGMR